MTQTCVLLLACLAVGQDLSAAAAEPPPRQPQRAALVPVDLQCEYLGSPQGIDQLRPRLGWVLRSRAAGPDVRGQKQIAYRVLVASDAARLAADRGDLWDSGKVESDQMQLVVYSGKPLTSRTACFWKVKVWDSQGRESAWSNTARWSMGLLEPKDWKARWISYRDKAPLHTDRKKLFLPPARHYRKEFSASGSIRRATLYFSSLGIADLYLNGRRVSDAVFMPGWSNYHRRCYYRTRDVTELVRNGGNCVGAIVAEGWYSGYVGYGLLCGYGPNRVGRYFYGKTPALLAQIEVEYTDGTKATIATDTTWKVTDAGPVREADIIMGETYDARAEMPGWSEAGYSAQSWDDTIGAEKNDSTTATFFDNRGGRPCELGFQRPKRMQAYSAPDVCATGEVKAVAMNEYKPGVTIFDLGQEIAGVVRLKVQGPTGTKVRLRFGEMLHRDGRLMTENLRRARATDYYILRGTPGGETWTPRFTYHGFRYVELTGLPTKPALDAVTGIVLHSDTPLVSSFECSDPMVNRLFENIVWTQRANFVEVPTDCPQRDERLGWTGDAQIYARAATYNADVAAFFTKWLDDLAEAQLPDGPYPDYAPYPMSHGKPGKSFGTAWMDAGVICPWTMWKVYGDERIVRRHFGSMTRFMQFREAADPELKGVSVGNTWGDWLNMDEATPIEYIDLAYHAYSARLMAEMAEAIGRQPDARQYRRRIAAIRESFRRQYVNADGTLKIDTQTAYVLALEFGLLPEKLVRPAAARLAEKIAEKDYRMATGFLGTKPLLGVLSANGHHDLALRLFQSRRLPSWGYEVVNGATTIWERWDSYTKDAGAAQHVGMNSYSHYAFGAVCQWMFQSLAGIDTDGLGFRRLKIRPRPGGTLTWVKAAYRSPCGPIRAAWKRSAGRFELELDVPPNTTATVYLPVADPAAVTEGGRPVGDAPGVKFLRSAPGETLYAVGSGSYHFEMPDASK